MSEAQDQIFMGLVFSLHSAAWSQLGKTANPMTGKIERDIAQARQTIDMLEMLQQKTGGNLSSDEKRMLDHFLYELRLNCVDELKKDEIANSGIKSPDESIKSDQ